MIIGLAGYIGAGKDSVGTILCEDFGFTRVSFAGAVKDLLATLDPYVTATTDGALIRLSDLLAESGRWEYAKTQPEVRRLLQVFGTDVVRDQIGPDAWVRLLEKRITEMQAWEQRPRDLVVTDVRFTNEVLWVLNQGGMVFWVDRPGTEPMRHKSERQLDAQKFPWILNHGTPEELRREVHRVLGVTRGIAEVQDQTRRVLAR